MMVRGNLEVYFRYVIYFLALNLFYLSFYLFKFPSHYGYESSIDGSYILLLFLILISCAKKIIVPKKYIYFSIIFLTVSIYSVFFTLFFNVGELEVLSDFKEGDTYFLRSDIAWFTSILSQFVFLCIIPPILGNIPKSVHVSALRLFLVVNSYFAIIQVLIAFFPNLTFLLPFKIGVMTSEGFNLSFARAVGLTSGHGAFYYSFGMLTAGLLLFTLGAMRRRDVIFVALAILSLSRSAFIITLIFLFFVFIYYRLKIRYYFLLFALVSFFIYYLFNSPLWELRLLNDRSSEIRGSQLFIALDMLFDRPFGIGGKHHYFFDGSFTAIIVEYGFLGIMGLLFTFFGFSLCLRDRFRISQVILILLMGFLGLSLTGSPFAYLPTLFIGMIAYFSALNVNPPCSYEKSRIEDSV